MIPAARVRQQLLGGVVGPVAFVAAWVLAGASASGYSAINDAISDLAAIDAGRSTRLLMSLGFVVFGIGLIQFGLALRELVRGPAWIAAIATGACTLGVAATPLGGWFGDGVHAAFAGLGYVTLVLLPLLAAGPLARAGRRTLGRAAVVIAAVAAVCLIVSTLGPAHGFWQRLGLTVVDGWIVITALSLREDGAIRRTN